MKVLIVEDEQQAGHNLVLMLRESVPEAQVMAIIPSISQTVKWLMENPEPDLAFFDIQLQDGLSFEILRKTELHFPVIFTTAYDQYAIQAFKVNSIDYLLKPIREGALLAGLRKYHRLKGKSMDPVLIENILHHLEKKRLQYVLAHFRDRIIPVSISNIAYFKIEEKVVFAITFDGKKYPLEESLDGLEESLGALDFFRANRQLTLNRKAVVDLALYFNGRILVNLYPCHDGQVLVSRARASKFKNWLRGQLV